MDKRLEEYRKFIDALVRLRPSTEAKWMKGKGWPRTVDNVEINAFLADLSDAQRDLLAEIIQGARDSGIHDVLAYLADEIVLGGFQLSRGDVPLAVEPYEREIYCDWDRRKEGEDWPEEPLKDEYRSER